MKKKDMVKDCIIHKVYVDSNDPIAHRLKYCVKNCQLKCKKGVVYKKSK